MKHIYVRRTLLCTLCLILILSLIPIQAAAAADASIGINGNAMYQYAWDVLDHINAQRAAAGAAPLEMDAVLLDAAMVRAAECAVYYDHTRPDGSDCFTVCDWRGRVGENIAAGYTSPEAVMDGWMHSDGHRANILDDRFKSVGVGVFQHNGFLFWVQLFDAGTPRNVEKSTEAKPVDQRISVSEKYVSLFSLQETDITLQAGESFQIDAVCNQNAGWKYARANIDREDLTYTCADTKVAVVSADGRISPTGNGTTTVSAYLPGCPQKALTYTVTVQGIEAQRWKKGDLNNDGAITSADIIYLRRVAASASPVPLQLYDAADVNGDSVVTMLDYVQLSRIAAGNAPYPPDWNME